MQKKGGEMNSDVSLKVAKLKAKLREALTIISDIDDVLVTQRTDYDMYDVKFDVNEALASVELLHSIYNKEESDD